MLPDLNMIKIKRRALGLSQQQLAEKLFQEVSRSTINKIENKKARPSYSIAKKIFDKLESLENERMTGIQNVTAKDIHNTPVAYADISETAYNVWVRMVDTKYSQLPVKDGNDIVGSITDKGLNQLFMIGDPKTVKLQSKYEEPFPIVPVNMSAFVVRELLQNCSAVLTVEDSKILGIITNTDIGKMYNKKVL